MNRDASLFGPSTSCLEPPVWRDAVAVGWPMPLTGEQVRAWQIFVLRVKPPLSTITSFAKGNSGPQFTPAPWARLCAWWALLWNPNVDSFEPLGNGTLAFTDRLEAACAPGLVESLSGQLRRAVVRLLVALVTETRVIHARSGDHVHSQENETAIICYQQLLARLLPAAAAGADGTIIWLTLLGHGRARFDTDEALSLTSLLDWMLTEAEIGTYWLMQADHALRRQVSDASVGSSANENVSWYLLRILAGLRMRGGRYSHELLADQIDALYGQYTAFGSLAPADIGLLLKVLGPRAPDDVVTTLLSGIFHEPDNTVAKQLAICDDTGLAAMEAVKAAVERVDSVGRERSLRLVGRIMQEGEHAVTRARKQAETDAQERDAAWAALGAPVA